MRIIFHKTPNLKNSQDYSNFCITKILITDGESIRLCIQSKAGSRSPEYKSKYPRLKSGGLPLSVKIFSRIEVKI